MWLPSVESIVTQFGLACRISRRQRSGKSISARFHETAGIIRSFALIMQTRSSRDPRLGDGFIGGQIDCATDRGHADRYPTRRVNSLFSSGLLNIIPKQDSDKVHRPRLSLPTSRDTSRDCISLITRIWKIRIDLPTSTRVHVRVVTTAPLSNAPMNRSRSTDH